MAIGRVLGVVSVLFLVSGCQTWRYQDVESLPPTAASLQTSQQGVVYALFWDDVAGTDLDSLTSLATYPESPDSMLELSELRGPISRTDNYGTLVRGYIIPPESGQYQFFVSGDDETRFSLSTSENIDTTAVIASVPGYTSEGSYTKYSSQRSSQQELYKGERYYFEILHKEGGGGDHFSVAWEGPGLTRQIIDGQYLASFSQSIYPDTPEIKTAYSLGYRVGFLDGREALTFNPDYPPLDADQDGLYDNWEIIHGLSPSDAKDATSDPDNDLLSAADEFLMGTSENSPDTDGDGIPDGVEFAYGLDPRVPGDASLDSDGDGYSNLEEYQAGTAIDDAEDTPFREPVYLAGFGGQYFNGTSFDEFVLVRNDQAIDFVWGQEAPTTAVLADTFSVRWSGLFKAPHAEGSRSYQFTTRTDDGVRLSIGGALVIDRWKDQGPTSYSHTLSFDSGQAATVLLEYYENRGGAVAQLTITDLSTGEVVPQESVTRVPAPSDINDLDTDKDGIPDSWELQHGLNPWSDDGASVHNGAGITSLEAYNSGLSPWTLEPVPTGADVPDGTSDNDTTLDTTGGVSLSWTAPSTRVDGSSIALSEIDYYEIRYGQAPDNLGQTVRVPGDLDSYRFTDLAPGSWYFSIRVVDDRGLASALSNVVEAKVP